MFQKSLEFYEEALTVLTDVGDRAGQIEVLLGRAETMHYSDMHSMVSRRFILAFKQF